MPEIRLTMRLARVLGVAGCTAALVTVTAGSTNAFGKGQAAKTCGGGSLCATSLKSMPLPIAATGPGTPAPSVQPASTFRVTAKSTSPATQRINSGSKLLETLNTGRRLICRGYQRRDASWFQFMLQTKRRMHINYLITDSIVNTTPDQIHFCLGAPYRFSTLSGKPARHAVLPDGTKGFTGLLPMCSPLTPSQTGGPQPCVVSIRTVNDSKSSTGVDSVLTLRIPATTKGGDPWGGG